MPPLVSVIVPTRNSAQTLGSCLESIRRQTYTDIETIVVDNSSTDSTLQIARNFHVKIFRRGPERSAQFNFGVLNSAGKYIYRIDSDMVANPNVIREAVDICERYSIDGVIVRLVSDPTISFWSKVRSYERMNLYKSNTNVAVRFLSRKAFDEIGGFDERLNGFEDYDLHDRFVSAGFKFGRISSNETHIGEPRTLAEIVRKHYYYGKDLRKYAFGRKDRGQRFRRLSIYRIGYSGVISKLLRQPNVFLGFLVYQFVRYLATAAGVAFGS